jgi:hypothetical protein
MMDVGTPIEWLGETSAAPRRTELSVDLDHEHMNRRGSSTPKAQAPSR